MSWEHRFRLDMGGDIDQATPLLNAIWHFTVSESRIADDFNEVAWLFGPYQQSVRDRETVLPPSTAPRAYGQFPIALGRLPYPEEMRWCTVAKSDR